MVPKIALSLLLLFIGTFATAQFGSPQVLIYDVADANGMTDVHAVDMNQDGRLDILSASNGYDRIEWMANLGNGQFSDPHLIGDINLSYQLVGYYAATAADFNGDSLLDVAAITRTSVLLYLNQGNGNFADSINITTNIDSGRDIHAADLDGDGDIDLLTASIYDNKIAWYANDGNGHFSDQIILSDQMNAARSVDIADFNVDGRLDVLAASSLDDKIVWFENEGAGLFSEALLISNEVDGPWEIKAEDMDGDGAPDVIAGNKYDRMVSWFENEGAGQFSGKAIIGTQLEDIETIQTGDINADSQPDVLVALGESHQIVWYLNEGGGSFSDRFVLPYYIGEPVGLDVADLDGDGDGDLLYASNFEDEMGWVENFDNTPQLFGTIYWDENANGQKEDEEIGLYGQKVTLAPDALAAWSDAVGTYRFAVDTGDYVLHAEALLGWTYSSPSQVEWTTEDSTAAINFGLVPDGTSFRGEIDITSAPTRCGFTVPFWINYWNTGNQSGNGTVSLLMDELVIFHAATPVPDIINGNELVWQIEDLPPTYSGQIQLQLEMPGVNSLGEYVEFASQIEWVDQADTSLFAKEYSYTSQINCAYDPNDKLVTPAFEHYPNYTLFGDTLVYTVRFQNTGTDTAFNVLLVDQLDEKLDWSTFEIIASSHPQSTTLDGRGRLNFHFDNILLPDTNTNEPESHGFVKFRIQAKDSLPEMAEVTNKADIFFDFNPPIETNTVSNLMVSLYPVIAETVPPTCFGDEDGSINIEFPFDHYQFDWSNGQTTPQIDQLSAGSYAVSVYDQEALIAKETLSLPDPFPIIVDTSSTPATGDMPDGTATVEVILATPPYNFLWNTDPAQTTPTAVGLAAGTYMVTVTDGKGCTAAINITVDRLTNATFKHADDRLRVFPNPSRGHLNILLEGMPKLKGEFQLTDATGRVCHKGTIHGSRRYQLAGLMPGFYLLSVQLPGKWLNRKILIR